jgi:hypothetical protein
MQRAVVVGSGDLLGHTAICISAYLSRPNRATIKNPVVNEKNRQYLGSGLIRKTRTLANPVAENVRLLESRI